MSETDDPPQEYMWKMETTGDGNASASSETSNIGIQPGEADEGQVWCYTDEPDGVQLEVELEVEDIRIGVLGELETENARDLARYILEATNDEQEGSQ